VRLPDFVIIGAMKSGTSTLHEQLALRSGIFMSDPKEPNFFSDDDQFARGIRGYSELFNAACREQLCGESSTHYTKLPTYPHTVERMTRHLSNPKLIYVMRDPLQRLVSQYIHEWTQREVRGSVARAARENERFLAYSCYARQLEPYLCAYGPSAVLPVFFERLLADPDQEFARVCHFIGDPSSDEPRWVKDLAPQNVSSERLRRSAVREGLLSLQPVRALKDRLPQSAREHIKRVWQLRRRPELAPGLREELREAIDHDLAKLGAWLGTTLSCGHWTEQVLRAPLDWVAPPGEVR
jgi:hypothetical protein